MRWCRGVTREVILAGGLAIKIPSIRCWRLFLTGMLANIHERLWWRLSDGDARLCPILFGGWLGFLLVMRRADPISEEEFRSLTDDFLDGLPADRKPDNFGRVGGRVVMVDYG